MAPSPFGGEHRSVDANVQQIALVGVRGRNRRAVAFELTRGVPWNCALGNLQRLLAVPNPCVEPGTKAQNPGGEIQLYEGPRVSRVERRNTDCQEMGLLYFHRMRHRDVPDTDFPNFPQQRCRLDVYAVEPRVARSNCR